MHVSLRCEWYGRLRVRCMHCTIIIIIGLMAGLQEEDRSLAGRVALVTGATPGGIGYATAMELKSRGAFVIIAGRKNKAGLAEATDVIEPGTIKFMELDLTSFASTKTFTENFKNKYTHLNILVNNAATTFTEFQETGDHHERHFQVNHLSPFLLTLELMSCLKQAAKDEGGARVVMVTSSSHKSAEFNPGNMNGEQYYSRFLFYYNSKLYNIMIAYCLQRRLSEYGITVGCVNPGKTHTNFIEEPCEGRSWLRLVTKAILYCTCYQSAPSAAMAVVNCVTTPSNDLYYNKSRYDDRKISKTAKKIKFQKQLWDISLAAVREHLTVELEKNFNDVEIRLLKEMAEVKKEVGNERKDDGELLRIVMERKRQPQSSTQEMVMNGESRVEVEVGGSGEGEVGSVQDNDAVVRRGKGEDGLQEKDETEESCVEDDDGLQEKDETEESCVEDDDDSNKCNVTIHNTSVETTV